MNDDTISRQAAIDAFRKELCGEREYATPFISFKGCERILNELPSAQPIDVQEAYYRGKIDGIKECTTRLKKMNDEVAKGDRDESSERTRPI